MKEENSWEKLLNDAFPDPEPLELAIIVAGVILGALIYAVFY